MTTLPRSRPLSRADLETMPDDGHRYELIDGVLVVTPAPVTNHQRAVRNLLLTLVGAAPGDLEVLTAPFDVVLAEDTVLQPDVLVARTSDLTTRNLPVAPVLAVEILSPSTRRIDLLLKRSRFESAGCASYWVLDPDEPSLIAWDLRDGLYAEVGRVRGSVELGLTLPFPVTICPAHLVV
ncbi:MAG: Uma2 family endonuclease [Tetrasphaera sp.]